MHVDWRKSEVANLLRSTLARLALTGMLLGQSMELAVAEDYSVLDTVSAKPAWDAIWEKAERDSFKAAFWCYRDKASEMIDKLQANSTSEQQFSAVFLTGGGFSGAADYAIKICDDAFQRLNYFSISEQKVDDARNFLRAMAVNKTEAFIQSCQTKYCSEFKSVSNP